MVLSETGCKKSLIPGSCAPLHFKPKKARVTFETLQALLSMSGSESSDWESESDSDDGDIFQYVEEQRRGRLRKALIVLKRRISLRRRLGPKGPNKEPPVFSWEEHVSDMDDAEFKKRYRLSTESFDELVVKIWDKLTARDTRRSKCSRGEWSGLSGQKCSARCHDVMLHHFRFKAILLLALPPRRRTCRRACAPGMCASFPRWWYGYGLKAHLRFSLTAMLLTS